jgi:hypothetical protein
VKDRLFFGRTTRFSFFVGLGGGGGGSLSSMVTVVAVEE